MCVLFRILCAFSYGVVSPPDLSLALTSATLPTGTCPLLPDHPPQLYNNHLSSLAAAELLRRIALFRELQNVPVFRWPNMTWPDAQVRAGHGIGCVASSRRVCFCVCFCVCVCVCVCVLNLTPLISPLSTHPYHLFIGRSRQFCWAPQRRCCFPVCIGAV
jgi:hypothetical protein